MSANAGDAIAFTSEGFMRKTYGDDWAEFAVAPDLLVLVKECFLISELVVHFEPRVLMPPKKPSKVSIYEEGARRASASRSSLNRSPLKLSQNFLNKS